jgi:oligoribonuclease NrnB/cAMP/cGMP phosphodiesterase (DHH superfamily)
MAILLDLETILPEFSDQMQQNLKFIYSLSLLPKPKVAFHGADADGIVSAVILRNLKEFQQAIFIPLEYAEIRHQRFGSFLTALNWQAIVDLPPFNTSLINLYCDHHLSNKSLTKNAKLVIFDENAPSAAYLLLNHFKDQIPRFLRVLADLTIVTDTAGFTIPPPEEIPANFDDATRQEQAWLLNDICRIPESTEDVISLFQDFSNHKLDIFSNKLYYEKILNLRALRKESISIGDQFELADVLVIIRGKKKIMTSALVNRLFERGVKITCILFPGKQFTGISLRVNSQISPSELENYRVDKLAAEFTGGGHPRAAGGRGTSLKTTMKSIVVWIKEHGFTHKEYDLRK